jgi:ribosomal peptide maturation radical SAM protein 1
MTKPNVLLVSMPWAMLTAPPLGLSVLKASLVANDIPVRVCHLHLQLLRYLRGTTYALLANTWTINDFVFSGALHPEISDDQLELLLPFCHRLIETSWKEYGYSVIQLADMFVTLRKDIIPKFLESCAEQVLDNSPTLVGFTCMYDQTFASLAMAKILKQKKPDLPIVFGGYAVHRNTGEAILADFPFVDGIVLGDGEDAICDLAYASIIDNDFSKLKGVLTPYSNSSKVSLLFYDINKSPIPDFDDYFHDIEDLNRKDKVSILTTMLPAVTSKGCWWGSRNHCIFCGIDEESLVFRQRSPENAYTLLKEYSRKYNGVKVQLSDYILPTNFYTKLLPMLKRNNLGIQFAAEIKSNVSRKQICTLKDAGFIEIQPGIESFSTPCLKKMSKGVSAIQNIYTLKLGLEYGIAVYYNILYGFPMDTVEEYHVMSKIIPTLTIALSKTDTPMLS